MFCLDPVFAIGYQHSSLSCFCWLLVYNPQFHSLNLCLKRHFTTQGILFYFAFFFLSFSWKKCGVSPLQIHCDVLDNFFPVWCSFVLKSLLLFLNLLIVKFLEPKGSSFMITWTFQQLKLWHCESKKWIDSSKAAAVGYTVNTATTCTLWGACESPMGTMHDDMGGDSKPQQHLPGTK